MFAPIPNATPAPPPVVTPAAEENIRLPTVGEVHPMQDNPDHRPTRFVPDYGLAKANPSYQEQLSTLEALRSTTQAPHEQPVIRLFGAEAHNPHVSSGDIKKTAEILLDYRISLDEMNNLRNSAYVFAELLLDSPEIIQPIVDSWDEMSPDDKSTAIQRINHNFTNLPWEKLFVRTDPNLSPDFFAGAEGMYLPEDDAVYLDALSPYFDSLGTAIRLLMHEVQHYVDYNNAGQYENIDQIIDSFKSGHINYDKAIAYIRIQSEFRGDIYPEFYFSDPLEQRAFLLDSFISEGLEDVLGWQNPSVLSDAVYEEFKTVFYESGIAETPEAPEDLPVQTAA